MAFSCLGGGCALVADRVGWSYSDEEHTLRDAWETEQFEAWYAENEQKIIDEGGW